VDTLLEQSNAQLVVLQAVPGVPKVSSQLSLDVTVQPPFADTREVSCVWQTVAKDGDLTGPLVDQAETDVV